MLKISFVNGDEEDVNVIENAFTYPWKYDKESECFIINSLDGLCIYPRDFIKSIKYIRVGE